MTRGIVEKPPREKPSGKRRGARLACRKIARLSPENRAKIGRRRSMGQVASDVGFDCMCVCVCVSFVRLIGFVEGSDSDRDVEVNG